MVETVERSKRFPMIGFHAIKEHPDLTWILGANISIGYLESDRAKKKNGTRMSCGMHQGLCDLQGIRSARFPDSGLHAEC